MAVTTAVEKASAERVKTVRDLLGKCQSQIAAALPKHLTAERMIRIALTAVQRSPRLLECSPISIVGSVIEASQLGLELGGLLGQAYLVPYYNKNTRQREAQMQVGYKGYLALADRSGKVGRFGAHVVREKDDFDYEYGSRAFLRHKPAKDGAGKVTHVWSEIAGLYGSYDFEVMTAEEIEAHRVKYANDNFDAWRSAWDEMAKKTTIRRLAKRAPMSVELQRAACLDERGELPPHEQIEGCTRAEELLGMLGHGIDLADVPQQPEPAPEASTAQG